MSKDEQKHNYISLMAHSLLSPSSLSNSSTTLPIISSTTSTIFGSKLKFLESEQTQLRLLNFEKDIILRLETSMQPSRLIPRDKTNPALRLKASMDAPALTQELKNDKQKSIVETQSGGDLFNEMKNRFLGFKEKNYLKNLEHYQNLAKSQSPKFLVIACADSRVCPSQILGFQPGEAFVVRNVANLVPPFETGPSETKAALEFSVNTLEVPNILVIGHSCCGGIRALMGMQDEENSSSFIRSWVVVGNNARLSTKAVASNLSFDQQCRHCEKESINRSMLNLLTYPWIEERVAKGLLCIHGGYYDFVDCTFEKWTLDYTGSSSKVESGDVFSIQNREFWC